MFDRLLRRLEFRVIPGQFVAYADDLIVVINDTSHKEIEQRGQGIVCHVSAKTREFNRRVGELVIEISVLNSKL